eukprot:19474_4
MTSLYACGIYLNPAKAKSLSPRLFTPLTRKLWKTSAGTQSMKTFLALLAMTAVYGIRAHLATKNQPTLWKMHTQPKSTS